VHADWHSVCDGIVSCVIIVNITVMSITYRHIQQSQCMLTDTACVIELCHVLCHTYSTCYNGQWLPSRHSHNFTRSRFFIILPYVHLISQLRSVSCVFTIKIGLDWIGMLWRTGRWKCHDLELSLTSDLLKMQVFKILTATLWSIFRPQLKIIGYLFISYGVQYIESELYDLSFTKCPHNGAKSSVHYWLDYQTSRG